MCVGASESIGCIYGGCSQSLRHGHPHIDTGKVHDYGLRKVERTERRGELWPSCTTPLFFTSHLSWCTHHGAAVGVGVEVTAEGNNYSSVQHVSGPRLGQPKHTHRLLDISQLWSVFVYLCYIVVKYSKIMKTQWILFVGDYAQIKTYCDKRILFSLSSLMPINLKNVTHFTFKWKHVSIIN